MTPHFKAPQGLDEIVARFGNIRDWIRADGTIHPKWESAALVSLNLPKPLALGWSSNGPATRIRCHREVAEPLNAVFQELHRLTFWSLLHTFDGCYAFRQQRGSSSKLSLHCWGAAIDLNAATNQLGTQGDMNPAVVEVFERYGFTWGGRFSRPDPMHFQFASGY